MSKVYKVRPGDCVASIAFEHGFFPDTLWNDPANEALKNERKNLNTLVAGDLITIPDLRVKQLSAATGKRHVFRRRGVPEKFRLRLEDDTGAARPGVAYTISFDDAAEVSGVTDDDGRLEQWIPPDTRKGVLTVDGAERYEMFLGRLPPLATDDGVRVRLINLGLLPADAPAEAVPLGVMRFQLAHDLDPTGVVDDALREKLAAAYEQ